MSNADMKAGRFLRWHKARKIVSAIQFHLINGGQVMISTCTKATLYKLKHAEMFKATKSGAYVQSGKKWVCIDYCVVQFY